MKVGEFGPRRILRSEVPVLIGQGAGRGQTRPNRRMHKSFIRGTDLLWQVLRVAPLPQITFAAIRASA